MIALLAYNPLYTAVDYEHGAGAAWSHTAVQGTSFYGDTPLCSLADSILLGMHCPYTMLSDMTVLVNHLLHLVSHLVAVGQSRRASYIAGNQYLVVLGYNTAAFASIAGCSLGDSVHYLKKIIIPGRSVVTHIYTSGNRSKELPSFLALAVQVMS